MNIISLESKSYLAMSPKYETGDFVDKTNFLSIHFTHGEISRIFWEIDGEDFATYKKYKDTNYFNSGHEDQIQSIDFTHYEGHRMLMITNYNINDLSTPLQTFLFASLVDRRDLTKEMFEYLNTLEPNKN